MDKKMDGKEETKKQFQNDNIARFENSSTTGPDPMIVFVAGAIVGLMVGPKLIQLTGSLLRVHAMEIANELLDNAVKDLRKKINAIDSKNVA